MLYSMTGFGSAEARIGERQVIVEIKALNGKQFEMVSKLPPLIKNYEFEIRSLLNSLLMRGTIDFSITIKQEGASKPMTVNTDLAAFYFKGMQQIADKIGVNTDNIISTLMRMPEVVAPDQDAMPEADWLKIKEVITTAANRLMEHRKHEGIALYKDIHSRVDAIEGLLGKVAPFETERVEKVRTRIEQMISDLAGKANLDPNRLEQEMIYYIERMDFSEEKTRLKQHCIYFHTTVDNKDVAIGRKLNFILQEMGREINTLGSKANHADIQQIVINMKDELEKAKEQINNIL